MADPRLVLLTYVLPAPATVDGRAVPQTGAFAVDCSVNEHHVTTAQVTTHQVESGQDVASYIRPMPRKLTLEAFVTNTPLVVPLIATIQDSDGFRAKIEALDRGSQLQRTVTVGGRAISFTSQDFGAEFDRVAEFYGGVMSAALAGAVWGVYTTLRTYSKMAIVNFAVPRSADSGNSLKGAIDFQEIRIAQTQVVAVPVRATAKRGTKPPIDASKEKGAGEKKISVARATVKSVFGF